MPSPRALCWYLSIALTPALAGCGPRDEPAPANAAQGAPIEDDPSNDEPAGSTSSTEDAPLEEDDPGALQAACYRGDTEACDQLGH